MRRAPKADGVQPDADGISVSLLAGRGEKETCEAMAGEMTTYFACRILTGDVRSVPILPELDLVQDSETHAYITGTPLLPQDVNTLEGKEQIERARYVGIFLSEKAVLVWTNHSPKK